MKKYYTSIINILIIIVILCILIFLFVPSVCIGYSKEEAIHDTMCLKMYDIEKRIQRYAKDHNGFPSSNIGLSTLLKKDLNNSYYLRKIPKDFWKNPFKYIKVKNGFELVSYGEDKIENTKDDIYLSKCKDKI